MRIYIAGSFKHEHGIEMLTDLLIAKGFEVCSFIRNLNEEKAIGNPEFDFEKWIDSERAAESFAYDIKAASECDIVIYYGASGLDAWTEIGIAYQSRRSVIIGLLSKGETIGLMRKCISKWFKKYDELILYLVQYRDQIENDLPF